MKEPLMGASQIEVCYERADTKAYHQATFKDWRVALNFARWVADSPELILISLLTIWPPTG